MQENGRKIALCHQCSLVRLDAQFPGEHCRSHVRARDKSDTVEEEEKETKKDAIFELLLQGYCRVYLYNYNYNR